jgi:hypothetical protein
MKTLALFVFFWVHGHSGLKSSLVDPTNQKAAQVLCGGFIENPTELKITRDGDSKTALIEAMPPIPADWQRNFYLYMTFWREEFTFSNSEHSCTWFGSKRYPRTLERDGETCQVGKFGGNHNLRHEDVRGYGAFPVHNLHPLIKACFLQFDTVPRDSYRTASLPSLPDDCTEGEHDSQCRDPFRPCEEFVPPLRVLGCALFIVISGLIVGYGRYRWRGRLTCVLLALTCRFVCYLPDRGRAPLVL